MYNIHMTESSIVNQYFEQRPKLPHRDERTLRVWHVEERMTPAEMADMWGISPSTVIE